MGSEGGAKARRVLIADNVALTANSIARTFEEAGFETAAARDGEECLEKARTFEPHLIILDLVMPKIHGIEVLRRLKADERTRPIEVIVCTVKGFRTDIQRAKQLDVADLVIKPFRPKDLLVIAREVLSARHTAATGTRELLVRRDVSGGSYLPELADDDARIRLWGTRGSVPVSGPQHAQHGGNTSCMTFEHGGEVIIFDAGSGIRDLGVALAAGAPRKLHLFITHTHWDHIQGFPFFLPAMRPGFEIVIYGARGFNKSLESLFRGQLDPDYFPVQMENLEAGLKFVHLDDPPICIGDVKISWEFTQHPGATLGYKMELAEKKVAFVPDNEIFQGYMGRPEEIAADAELMALYRPILDFLEEVDVLIHEAQYTPTEYSENVHFGHSSVPNACFLAKVAGVKRWIVTHHDPDHSDDFLRAKLNLTRRILDDLGHPVHVSHAYDGLIEYL